MEIASLASGSSGNCFYVKEGDCAVLIDAGISTKQIVERLGILKMNPEDIRAVFVTHEHSDHIRGCDYFARKFNVPIYATKKTIQHGFLCSDESLINHIKNNETVEIGKMRVEAFSKSHKAADPVSYNVYNGKKISIITDAGHACKNIVSHISDSDFLCLESNHDEEMLENGPYPYFLKSWIKSNEGHLSNSQAALCVLEHARSKLSHLMLSHLSRTNNTPRRALETFKILKERRDLHPKIMVSERGSPSPLFKI